MLKKIYALIAAVLLVSVILTGLIAYNVIQDMNRNSNLSKLQSAVNLIETEMKNGRPYVGISDLLATTFPSGEERIRFTIIDMTGKVLYDNESDAASMENHMYRPEVRAAISTKTSGQATRKSSTLNADIYYYAEYQPGLDLVIRTAIPMTAYLKTVNSVMVQLLVIVGIALISLVLIGFVAANLVTRPLVDLKKAAISMSGGQYDIRIARGLNDTSETGQVALAFNKMAEQLQSIFNELGEKNAQQDIILNSMGNPILAVDSSLMVTFMNRYTKSEFANPSFSETGSYPLISIVRNSAVEKIVNKAMKNKTQENAEMVLNTRTGDKNFRIVVSPIISVKSGGAIITFQDITQIQKLQKMRSEFVANVTHELKTPLTSIRGFVDTLRQGAIKNPDVSERFLEIIDVEVERLYKLISDILSLSEIEDMKEDPDSSEFDMNSLIDEVIVLLDDATVEKHISVLFETGEDNQPFMVKASRNRIKQVLINLVENAIKYNVENGKVDISVVRNEAGDVVLKVKDTGNGIPGEHIPRVFERFYRVDKSRSKELGGTGLGLSIVKHIAMLYDGNATVESTVGQGSEFTVVMKI